MKVTRAPEDRHLLRSLLTRDSEFGFPGRVHTIDEGQERLEANKKGKEKAARQFFRQATKKKRQSSEVPADANQYANEATVCIPSPAALFDFLSDDPIGIYCPS